MATAVELREQLTAKQEAIGKAFQLAGEEKDFAKKEVLEHLGAKSSSEAIEKLRAWNAEADELFKKAKEAADLEAIEAGQKSMTDELRRPVNFLRHPADSLPIDRQPTKSFGQMFVESEAYKGYQEAKGAIKEFSVLIDMDVKTLLQTPTGWLPESTRTGLLVEAVTRPIQILDLIPTDTTTQASVVYLEETLRTHGAAERAEGAVYGESAFQVEERTSQVRSIGDSLPVTDEQLEDVGQIRSYINSRLLFGCRQRLDSQVITGTGVSPLLRGILNVVGIQTQAKGTEPTFDAVHKAMTKVRVTGRAFPNAIVMHPNDWQEIRLTRTADGIYIMGNPSVVGPMTLFGLPVTVGDVITENTGLVGDFANFCRLFERRGIEIRVGYVADQFKEGKQTIRAEMRVAFITTRPAAFCTVTGI